MATVSNIVTRAASHLNDVNHVRWSVAELVEHVNEAMAVIVALKPNTNAVTAEIQLVEGTKQDIPSDGVRLIDVIRNTGVDGGVPSAPIRIIERDTLDTLRPTWHKDRSSNVVKNYVFDERNPKTFYVYPPSRGQHIEVVYSQMPATVVNSSQLGVFDFFQAALLDYVLYRAFDKETEEGSNARSAKHYQAFYSGLGLIDESDRKAFPNYHAPPKNKTTTGEAY